MRAIPRDESLSSLTESPLTGSQKLGHPEPESNFSFDLVQLFVEVDDVEVATQRATELGAAVVMPRQLLPDGDEMAIIHDAFGITFGLWRKS